MNALTKILIAGAAILGVPTAAAAQEIDVETIVHNASAQAYYQGENGRARARMTIVDRRTVNASGNLQFCELMSATKTMAIKNSLCCFLGRPT